MIDELLLFSGQDIPINEHITIHQPTLKEIVDLGETIYYESVMTLCATPSDYKLFLYDKMGIDYRSFDEFSMFILLYNTISPQVSRLVFPTIEMDSFVPMCNQQNEDLVLYDRKSETVIDIAIYIQMTNYLRAIHKFHKNTDRAGNDNMFQYELERDRRRLRYHNNQPNKSILLPLISSLVNCAEFKYDHTTVWNLHLYQFMDSVSRIQKIKNFDHIMQGIYTGNINPQKLSSDSLNWLGNLD